MSEPSEECEAPRPNPTVFATLQARDAPGLIDYYVQVFGFTLTARYDDDDLVSHAQLNWPEGNGAVMLGSHRPENDWSREPGTAGMYVVTSDPIALSARITAAVVDHGGEIVRPLQDTDYGAREFMVRDPEGNIFSFGDYPGE